MHLDVDAYASELERPSITLGGVKYLGRHCSMDEWLIIAARLDAWQATGHPNAFRLALVEMADPMFPHPPSPPDERRWYQRRRWLPWWFVEPAPLEPSVADQLLELPIPVQLRVMRDFIKSQEKLMALRLGPEMATAEPETRSKEGPTTPSGASDGKSDG